MSARPRQPCSIPRCPNLTPCPLHQREPWAGRRGFEGYKGEWMRIRRQVLDEEPCCRECGAPGTTVDHIIPRARGGTDTRTNLRGLCGPCRERKDAADAAEGRRLARG